jgi:hypothetical protein
MDTRAQRKGQASNLLTPSLNPVFRETIHRMTPAFPAEVKIASFPGLSISINQHKTNLYRADYSLRIPGCKQNTKNSHLIEETTLQVPRMSQQPNENRTVHRFITTHDAEGKAIFSDAIPTEAPIREIGTDGNMTFSLMYTNPSFPANMDGEKDISTYQGYMTTPPKITLPGGSICRVCDFAPGYLTAMHRTPSLDFGVCLEGEVELVLDSGETRVLKRGDVAVQRYVATRNLINIPP